MCSSFYSIKRVNGKYSVFSKGGREDTGIDAIEWAIKGEKNGAGELVINSIDTDGVKNGFDIELLKEIADNVSIPLIASGGAGNMEHFKDVFQVKGVDAGLAASIFHFKEINIKELKEYLHKNKIEVRL
nr:HisA/HisF-related TIM barrel protein [Brachyspira hyodysenteriae]